MLDYLIGSVNELNENYIVLEVNGLGIKIYCSNPFSFKLKEHISIKTYLHLTENEISVYGFKDNQEKDLFIKLIAISGIGPKTAFAIIKKNDYKNTISAIKNEDLNFLKNITGIGTKTAMQIIFELKDKFNNVETNDYKIIEDAKIALKSLSFKSFEIDNAVSKLVKQYTNTNECLKDLLVILRR